MSRLFLIFLMLICARASAESCAEVFKLSQTHRVVRPVVWPRDRRPDWTPQFISLLDELVRDKLLGKQELHQMMTPLEVGEVPNPLNNAIAHLNSIKFIISEFVRKQVAESYIDPVVVLDWVKFKLQELQQEEAERGSAARTTESSFQRLVFSPVRPGSFFMGEGVDLPDKPKVFVEFTNWIEVSSTPITQAQWVEIMGWNPSDFKQGQNLRSVKINNKYYEMQPDNPVENVTWWSAAYFTNKLSESHNLPPVYDFSNVRDNFVDLDRARNGAGLSVNLISEEEIFEAAARGSLAVGSLLFDSMPLIHADSNDIYNALGFRLLTIAEMEFLLRVRGDSSRLYFFGPNSIDMNKYVWSAQNSDNTTHPVGLLRPLIIEGYAFYDVLGNIRKWTHDIPIEAIDELSDPPQTVSDIYARLQRTNPIFGEIMPRKIHSYRAAKGGGFTDYDFDLHPDRQALRFANERVRLTGLMVGRTLRKNDVGATR